MNNTVGRTLLGRERLARARATLVGCVLLEARKRGRLRQRLHALVLKFVRERERASRHEPHNAISLTSVHRRRSMYLPALNEQRLARLHEQQKPQHALHDFDPHNLWPTPATERTPNTPSRQHATITRVWTEHHCTLRTTCHLALSPPILPASTSDSTCVCVISDSGTRSKRVNL